MGAPDPKQPLANAIPGLDAWDAWRPDEATSRLAGVTAPWCVAGGWALDLWQGRQTRPHDDMEIAILREDFPIFRAHLHGFGFFIVGSGEVSPLPSGADLDPGKHQVWILEEPARTWRMDIFLEPGDLDTWVFRRDETIRCVRSRMAGTTAEGVPYLKPEGVLLYKAKAARAKDERDFSVCVPLMEPASRAWLGDNLARVHPGHSWIGRLEDVRRD